MCGANDSKRSDLKRTVSDLKRQVSFSEGRFLDRVKVDLVPFDSNSRGAVAQLAERVARIHEARGSNPLSSTNHSNT